MIPFETRYRIVHLGPFELYGIGTKGHEVLRSLQSRCGCRIGAGREICEKESVGHSAPHGRKVMRDIGERDFELARIAEHVRAHAVSDQDDVQIGVLKRNSGRIVVAGQNRDLLALTLLF